MVNNTHNLAKRDDMAVPALAVIIAMGVLFGLILLFCLGMKLFYKGPKVADPENQPQAAKCANTLEMQRTYSLGVSETAPVTPITSPTQTKAPGSASEDTKSDCMRSETHTLSAPPPYPHQIFMFTRVPGSGAHIVFDADAPEHEARRA